MTSTVSSAEPLVQGAFFKPCELSAPFNWQPGLLRKLDELRCMGQFCDVTIQVDDTIGDASFLPYMRVHSVIVAAGSPMLHEKLQDPSFAGSVLVAGVGVWQWEQVINFLYTGKVCLTASGQAEALVQAAIELKMEVLVNMLQDHLGPSDAAAVEDVKPLKSRQAADTSEPMDDDDEDNDAGAASTDGDDDEKDKNTQHLPTEQKTYSQMIEKNSGKKTTYVDDNDSNDHSTITTKHRELKEISKVEPPENDSDWIPTKNISGSKLNTSKQNNQLGAVINQLNVKIKEPEDEDDFSPQYEEDDDDDSLDEPEKYTDNPIRKLRKRAGGLRNRDAKPESRSKRGERKMKRVCKHCKQSFLYEKSFLNHKCKKPKKDLKDLPSKVEVVPKEDQKTRTNRLGREARQKKREESEFKRICDVCEKTFDQERYARSHKCRKQNSKCYKCGTAFMYEAKFLKHICHPIKEAAKDDDIFNLSSEGEENEDETEVIDTKETIATKRERSEKGKRKSEKITCEGCTQIFQYEKNYLKHKCAKPKEVPTDKYAHYRTQDGETIDLPLPESACPMCSETFTDYKLMKRHAKDVHDVVMKSDGPKPINVPIKCPYCEVTNPRRKLISHVWKCHGYRVSGLRNRDAVTAYYKCPECGIRSLWPKRIETHIKVVHGGLRAYMCDVCGHCLATPIQLKNHLRSHTDERPFLCKHCPSTFRTRKAVRNHELLHVGYKPFKCNLCAKEFTQSASANFHMRNHHPHLTKEQYKDNRTYTPISEAGRETSEVREIPSAFRRKTKRKRPAIPVSPPRYDDDNEDITIEHSPVEDSPPPRDAYPHTNELSGASLMHAQQYHELFQGQYSGHHYPLNTPLNYSLGASSNAHEQSSQSHYQKL